ncbi:uncharacterized protein LOC122282138 [Carya illinoinensis]|uniref:uncharacterized protein LOC122282138 n=1 Tax=Carya illinoinensis TaxID=32201 RepID=UPI001C718EFA|nr:uncharacterized protein LOC122282138 [Carya illinoinensis]
MEVLSSIDMKVTTDMNVELLKPFVTKEVEDALKQMHPSKAPRPDGMSPIFFQKYWHVLGKSVTDAFLLSLNSGDFPSELNHTFLTLIPKKASPSKVADFRPISLCNVLYKILSKVIANRLKKILPDVISDIQCAFVPGRQISDNVLIAYETLHFLRLKRYGTKGFMSLKLDMSKAYDRVEWTFLAKIMESLGFARNFISLIMKCVRTISFSVLVNGSPKGPIIPSRGIKQGDPLSPYLFLLCTEGLISLFINSAGREGVKRVQICRGAPRVNHLLFADDSLIFCQANVATNEKIQILLNKYERASGHCINKEKTSMVFSKNVSDELKSDIMQLWGGSHTQQYEKYLELPPLVGRSKKQAFSSIKSRVWQKLQLWKSKLLSQGGREVLIKAVGMSIPTYAMSCFLFPKSLCKELEMMMASFGGEIRGRGINFTRWRSVGNRKSVNFFKDPWIPDYNLPLNNSEFDEDLKVHSLIDMSTGWWNIQALRALFNPNVVQKILQLNISVHVKDSLFWVHEKNGIYSVNSAYRMLQQGLSNDMGQDSRESMESVFWRCLWHLKIPKQIKIFAWRACHEKLPTFKNLKHKHVLENDICVICTSCVEDAAHALFYCSDVRQVWLDYCPKLGEIVSDLSFWDLANLAHDRGSNDVLATFLVVAWGLWNRRNKFIYEDVSLHITTAINSALSLQQDESFSAGVGVILRDHNGDVVVVVSKVEREVSSAEFIEVIALLRGLQLCAQWGVPKIILKSNSLILVNSLNESSKCLTDFDFILQDFRRLVNGFEEARLEHVHRLGNGAAHQLARYAKEVEDIVM